jgi:hypothetical protein
MRTNEAENTDAPQANAPDARPPTHDGSESRRAANQPYAAEAEDYQAGNIKTPKEPDPGERARIEAQRSPVNEAIPPTRSPAS